MPYNIIKGKKEGNKYGKGIRTSESRISSKGSYY